MSARTDIRSSRRTALKVAVEDSVAVLGMPGRLVSFQFRGRRCTAIAELRPEALAERPRGYDTPITDVIGLELVTGSGDGQEWRRPVALHAVIESGRDATTTVHRASRWASYAARVAVVPDEHVNDSVLLEATLRGIWVVAAGRECVTLSVQGDTQPVAGSSRGLLHRLLDEVVAEALIAVGAQDSPRS